MSGVMNLSFNDYIDIASCPLVPCTFNQKCPRNDACGVRECCPSVDVNFIQSENEVSNSEDDCIYVGWTTCALKLFIIAFMTISHHFQSMHLRVYDSWWTKEVLF